ncbi:MAG: deoxyribonuclease IV [Candidatus Andersenbacteria bacterium]|nr:deoxyribonuclease IV [Candidatus Andersenbacteria bacterium]
MAISYRCIGVHVSAAGGVENAPGRAKEAGAECFQFFSRSPRGGAAPRINAGQASEFRAKCKQYGFESYIHTPYYINFASKKKQLRESAPRIVQEELARGSMLGVKYVVTHLGSARDWAGASAGHTPREALDATAAGLREIFAGRRPASTAGEQQFSAKLLLEISAGSGSVIGDKFEELVYLLDKLGRADVYVCLDTCHLFASGYDVRTAESWQETMRQFRSILGIAQLKLVHANDSKTGFKSHVDRHEHIDRGKIGAAGFRAMLAHPDLQKVNFILETPSDKLITEDIKKLKKWRIK